MMRDDYDRDRWARWAPIPAPAVPEPYVCRTCGVVVRGPADPRHNWDQHVPPDAA